MIRPLSFALVFIATCTASPWAEAAKVYKCGNTYSQVPCPDGVELNTGAGPSATQQRAAQKESREVEKAADQMEKERQKQERAQAKAQQAAEKERKAAAAAEEKEAAATKKMNASKDKGTLYFTAKVPAIKASQPK